MSVCRVPERWILGFHEVSNSEVPPMQSTVLRGEWSAASAPHSLLCSSTLWWFAGACCELMQLSNWAESIPEKGWRDCCWVRSGTSSQRRGMSAKPGPGHGWSPSLGLQHGISRSVHSHALRQPPHLTLHLSTHDCCAKQHLESKRFSGN